MKTLYWRDYLYMTSSGFYIYWKWSINFRGSKKKTKQNKNMEALNFCEARRAVEGKNWNCNEESLMTTAIAIYGYIR